MEEEDEIRSFLIGKNKNNIYDTDMHTVYGICI